MKVKYKKQQTDDLINIPKIVNIHYFEFDSDFIFKAESHDFWEMVYVDKGDWLINTDSQTFTLSQGQCYFHKPGEIHYHRATGTVAPNIFIVSFICNSQSMDLFEAKIINVPASIRTIISNMINEGAKTFDLPFNETELKELQKLPQGILGGEQMIRIYLEQFLILLLRSEAKTPEIITQYVEGLSVQHLASKMKTILDTTAYQSLSVEQFCAEMKYSKTYLSKIFLKNYGYTINSYMNKVKIDEAKSLIRLHTYTISQISDMLYFSNPFYFSRVFKRVTGMSPSEYKNSVKID